MRLLHWTLAFAFATSSIPSLAPADEPAAITADEATITERARVRVETGLVRKLAEREKERSRFSRARPAPIERRVRITNPTMSTDPSGRAFFPFAIDVRFGSDWTENDQVGCVYTSKGDIFVKSGDEYRPGAFLLGKNVDAVTGVCEAPIPQL